jgi:ketosteroid isomerase-like protein
MSQENVELVRQLFAELASGGPAEEIEQRLSDEALVRFFDPEVEWVPVTQSLLAVDSYRGYEGVRRFWTEFLSTWDEYTIEPLEFVDAGDRVAVVMHMVGLTHGIKVEATWSSLSTIRDGRVARVQSFSNPKGALEAAGL